MEKSNVSVSDFYSEAKFIAYKSNPLNKLIIYLSY